MQKTVAMPENIATVSHNTEIRGEWFHALSRVLNQA